MDNFVLHPILGLKTNCPHTDPELFQWISERVARGHCVDGRNIDFNRIRNTCSKSEGMGEWSNDAVATPTTCNGIFELYDGTNRVIWMVYDGDVYRYDSSRDPQEVADSGPTAFASDAIDLYSFIRYGSYMVFADRAEHTPYCSDHNDANLVKLISSGTEFKFRYLESFARRIIGAYSDQTNGHLEIRWSNANPTPNSDCVLAAANQLFVPNDDTVTGIKKMGQNACYVYCEDSINRLDYYANYSSPFGFTTIVDGQGCTGHHSIINENGINYFHNRNLGFCMYDGGTVTPISRDIENWVRDIKLSSAPYIVGAANSYANELIWAVPLEAATTNNALLVYDYVENKWSRRDFAANYIAPIVRATNVTWTKLTTELGYTTWASLGDLRWADLMSETPAIAASATDGELYTLTTEENDGADYEGYRTEPALALGGLNKHSILKEIWFSVVTGGSFSIFVHYRSGDTEHELKNASWTILDEVSFDSPSDAVCRLNNLQMSSNRLHQIKWGTDAKSEQFGVNRIEFRFESEGQY